MKALVTVASGEVVQLLMQGGELPEVGSYYFLEKSEGGTGAQNKAFHALVLEYWRSGMHSYDAHSYADFRNMIKRHLGEGFESYLYIDHVTKDHPFFVEVKSSADIPQFVKDAHSYKKDMIRGRLKSWSDYTKKQRMNTIDNLIAEMHQAGVNTKKFQEILEGLEK